MAAYLRGMTKNVTCRLTACIPGSAPGPTLVNECGRTYVFTAYICNLSNIDDDKDASYLSLFHGHPLSKEIMYNLLKLLKFMEVGCRQFSKQKQGHIISAII